MIDDEATEKRVQKNDPRLKRAYLLQCRCTVTSGYYDGLLSIETFSTNKMIEHWRKDLTIRGVEDNDDFRMAIKKLKEKLQSLVPEGTTAIELMHPDNVALGPLEISAIKRSKGPS